METETWEKTEAKRRKKNAIGRARARERIWLKRMRKSRAIEWKGKRDENKMRETIEKTQIERGKR
jgi:hypothetical protein